MPFGMLLMVAVAISILMGLLQAIIAYSYVGFCSYRPTPKGNARSHCMKDGDRYSLPRFSVSLYSVAPGSGLQVFLIIDMMKRNLFPFLCLVMAIFLSALSVGAATNYGSFTFVLYGADGTKLYQPESVDGSDTKFVIENLAIHKGDRFTMQSMELGVVLGSITSNPVTLENPKAELATYDNGMVHATLTHIAISILNLKI